MKAKKLSGVAPFGRVLAMLLTVAMVLGMFSMLGGLNFRVSAATGDTDDPIVSQMIDDFDRGDLMGSSAVEGISGYYPKNVGETTLAPNRQSLTLQREDGLSFVKLVGTEDPATSDQNYYLGLTAGYDAASYKYLVVRAKGTQGAHIEVFNARIPAEGGSSIYTMDLTNDWLYYKIPTTSLKVTQGATDGPQFDVSFKLGKDNELDIDSIYFSIKTNAVSSGNKKQVEFFTLKNKYGFPLSGGDGDDCYAAADGGRLVFDRHTKNGAVPNEDKYYWYYDENTHHIISLATGEWLIRTDGNSVRTVNLGTEDSDKSKWYIHTVGDCVAFSASGDVADQSLVIEVTSTGNEHAAIGSWDGTYTTANHEGYMWIKSGSKQGYISEDGSGSHGASSGVSIYYNYAYGTDITITWNEVLDAAYYDVYRWDYEGKASFKDDGTAGSNTEGYFPTTDRNAPKPGEAPRMSNLDIVNNNGSVKFLKVKDTQYTDTDDTKEYDKTAYDGKDHFGTDQYGAESDTNHSYYYVVVARDEEGNALATSDYQRCTTASKEKTWRFESEMSDLTYGTPGLSLQKSDGSTVTTHYTDADNHKKNDMKKANDHPNYSGNGFIADVHYYGNQFAYYITVPESGYYQIATKYAFASFVDEYGDTVNNSVNQNNWNSTTMTLTGKYADGTTVKFEGGDEYDQAIFPRTDEEGSGLWGWANYRVNYREMYLQEGTNTFYFTFGANDTGHINIDCVEVKLVKTYTITLSTVGQGTVDVADQSGDTGGHRYEVVIEGRDSYITAKDTFSTTQSQFKYWFRADQFGNALDQNNEIVMRAEEITVNTTIDELKTVQAVITENAEFVYPDIHEDVWYVAVFSKANVPVKTWMVSIDGKTTSELGEVVPNGDFDLNEEVEFKATLNAASANSYNFVGWIQVDSSFNGTYAGLPADYFSNGYITKKDATFKEHVPIGGLYFVALYEPRYNDDPLQYRTPSYFLAEFEFEKGIPGGTPTALKLTWKNFSAVKPTSYVVFRSITLGNDTDYYYMGRVKEADTTGSVKAEWKDTSIIPGQTYYYKVYADYSQTEDVYTTLGELVGNDDYFKNFLSSAFGVSVPLAAGTLMQDNHGDIKFVRDDDGRDWNDANTKLKFDYICSNAANVSWPAAATNEKSKRKPQCYNVMGPTGVIYATVPGSVTTCDVGDLVPGEKNTVYVQAVFGTVTATITGTVTTPDMPTYGSSINWSKRIEAGNVLDANNVLTPEDQNISEKKDENCSGGLYADLVDSNANMLAFVFDVPQTGDYLFTFAYAANVAKGTCRIQVGHNAFTTVEDGAEYKDYSVDYDNTEALTSAGVPESEYLKHWFVASVPVRLSGTGVNYIEFRAVDEKQFKYNIDYVELTSLSNSSIGTGSGVSVQDNQIIQAELYSNQTDSARKSRTSRGYATGDVIIDDFSPAATGTYHVTFRYASSSANGTIRMTIDGHEYNVNYNGSADRNVWNTVSTDVDFDDTGTHSVHIYPNGADIDFVRFTFGETYFQEVSGENATFGDSDGDGGNNPRWLPTENGTATTVIDRLNHNGAYADFTFNNVPSEGDYYLTVHYVYGDAGFNANGGPKVIVNDTDDLDRMTGLTPTGGWNLSTTNSVGRYRDTVHLNAGTNKIRLLVDRDDVALNVYSIMVSNEGGGVSGSSTVTKRYQAEDMPHSENTPSVDSDQPGFDGTGFLGHFAAGNWVKFENIEVPSDGSYNVKIRYATDGYNAGNVPTRHIGILVNTEDEGQRQSLGITPGSSNWTSWETVETSVQLHSGSDNYIVIADTGDAFNIDYIEITYSQSGIGGETKEHGHKYEAESDNYAVRGGGEDNRPPTINRDTAKHGGFSGTGYVESFSVGDYVEFTVNVPTTGQYNMSLRYAVNAGTASESAPWTGTIGLRINDQTNNIPVNLTTPGDWDDWRTLLVPVSLDAGSNLIRFTMLNTHDQFNVDYISISVNSVYWKSEQYEFEAAHNASENKGDSAYGELYGLSTVGSGGRPDTNGYVGNYDNNTTDGEAEDRAEMKATVPVDGIYNLTLKYEVSVGSGYIGLIVNDKRNDIVYWTSNTGWGNASEAHWNTITKEIALKAGENTLSFTGKLGNGEWGQYNLDYFTLEYVGPYSTTVYAPTNVEATVNDGDKSVTITWQDRSNADHVLYNVYRNGSLIKSGVDGMTFTDESVYPGTHTYYVIAVNDYGIYSDRSTATPKAKVTIEAEDTNTYTIKVVDPDDETRTFVTIEGVKNGEVVRDRVLKASLTLDEGYKAVDFYADKGCVTPLTDKHVINGYDVIVYAKCELTVGTLKVTAGENGTVEYSLPKSAAIADANGTIESGGSINTTVTIGDEIKLTAKPNDGCKFLYWIKTSTGKAIAYSATYTLYAGVDYDIKAVFTDGSTVSIRDGILKKVISTYTINGGVLDITDDMLTKIKTVRVVGYSVKGLKVNDTEYTFDEIESNGNKIEGLKDGDIIETIMVSDEDTKQLHYLRIDGNIRSEQTGYYSPLTTFYVEAAKTKGNNQFRYWVYNGRVISTQAKFFFITGSDPYSELIAVYENDAWMNDSGNENEMVDKDDGPSIKIHNVYVDNFNDPDNKRDTGDVYVTARYDFNEFNPNMFYLADKGVLLINAADLSNASSLDLSNSKAKKIRSTATTTMFVAKFNNVQGGTYYTVAYLTYRDSEDHVYTVYSAVSTLEIKQQIWGVDPENR